MNIMQYVMLDKLTTYI